VLITWLWECPCTIPGPCYIRSRSASGEGTSGSREAQRNSGPEFWFHLETRLSAIPIRQALAPPMKLLWILPCFLLPLPALAAYQETPPPGVGDEAEKEVVRAVAVSPDGKWIAAGYSGGGVALLDAKDGKHVRDFAPPLPDDAWVLAFSPNGERLAGLARNGMLVLWGLAAETEGKPPGVVGSLEAVPPPDSWSSDYDLCSSLAWSPSGDRLVAGHYGGSVSCLWTAHGELVLRWTGSPPNVTTPQLGWCSDGSRFVTIDGRIIQVRSAKTGRILSGEGVVGTITCPDEIVALAVQPRGRLVATGHAHSMVRTWNLDTGKPIATRRLPDQLFSEPEDSVAAIAFSPCGKRLALSVTDGVNVFVVHARTLEQIWCSGFVGAHFGERMPICWTPDGSHLWFAFGCGGGELHCVEPKEGAEYIEIGTARIPQFGGSIGAYNTDEGIRVVHFDGERVW
jgi:WD40 repeat protein